MEQTIKFYLFISLSLYLRKIAVSLEQAHKNAYNQQSYVVREAWISFHFQMHCYQPMSIDAEREPTTLGTLLNLRLVFFILIGQIQSNHNP